jgi:hypothetical protein
MFRHGDIVPPNFLDTRGRKHQEDVGVGPQLRQVLDVDRGQRQLRQRARRRVCADPQSW